MKKFLSFALIMFAFTMSAQTTIANKLKINNAPDGATHTRVMTQDATTKELGWILKTDLASDLEAVTDNGDTTTNSVKSSNGTSTASLNPNGNVVAENAGGQFASLEPLSGLRINQGGAGFQVGTIRPALVAGGTSSAILPAYNGYYTLGRSVTLNGVTTAFDTTGDVDLGTITVDGFVPLSGTTAGNEVTGDIEMANNNLLYSTGISGEFGIDYGEDQVSLYNDSTYLNILADRINVNAASGSRGISGSLDYSANLTDLDYTQKKYVDDAIAAAGGGTVTSVTGTDGVSVALGTSTLVIGLGDITPDSVAASGDVNAGGNLIATGNISGNNILGTDLFVTGSVAANSYSTDGSVSDAELKRINTLTSNAQTQIDAKQNLVTLTTTGSGAATFNQSTGALNIPTPSAVTVDSTPTDGSTNAVSSDGTFDALAAKQDVLVSATNIKTINSQSLLGSGNLVLSGTGDALVANPLSQFASTTSAQLAGVLSNETGTGAAVFGTSPTISTTLNVSDGTNTQTLSFGTIGGTASQPIYGGANGYEAHQPTAANTAERFYIMPKGTPTGTTSKFEMFQGDYINDLTKYEGFHLFLNNTTNQIIMGPNHSNTGTPTRQRFTIYGYSIGSTPDASSSILDFATDNTIKATAAGNLQVFSTTAGSCGMSSFGNAIPSAANTVLASYLGGATNGTTPRNGGRMTFRSDATWTAGSSHPTRIDFETIAASSTTLTERWRISSGGNFSNTGATGTAYLHLKAGTATASTAPIKLTAGTINTTAEAGTLETNASNELYYSTGTAANARGFVQVNRYVAKTTTYTATADDYVIDCTSGTFTVTLPTAVGATGRMYVVKNSGAGTITIGTTSSQTIDGASTKSLAVQYGTTTVMSNGANWIVTNTF